MQYSHVVPRTDNIIREYDIVIYVKQVEVLYYILRQTTL